MRDFLDAIYGEQGTGLIEVRLISTDHTVEQRWFEYPDEVDFVTTFNSVSFNTFAGVLLRTRMEGTADAVVQDTPVLWADFDSKNFGDDRMKTFYAVKRIDIPPQIMVDSGHGFHAYWLLDEKLDVRTAQVLMQMMANKYGSDVVGDPARIMRLPGTYNVKDPSDPRLVRLIKFEPLERSRTADFFEYLIPEKPQARRTGPYEMPYEIKDLGRFLDVDPPRGQRSEAVFAAVCAMVRMGYDEVTCYTTLVQAPVGEKIREMNLAQRERWFNTTFANAIEAVRLG